MSISVFGCSTFSFIKSISVVPPPMKRISAPCCAVVAFAAVAIACALSLAHALNCRDLFALVHGGEAKTRIHAPTIDVHRARTALTVIASLFGAGQMQMFTQTIEQSGARIDPQIMLLAVHTKCDRDRIF